MKFICLGSRLPTAPYPEAKGQLGGIQILEARDLNHAIQLVSQRPGFKYGLGPIEIRPIVDLTEMIKDSDQRRRRNTPRLAWPRGKNDQYHVGSSPAGGGKKVAGCTAIVPVAYPHEP
jgi:YCII-related domain